MSDPQEADLRLKDLMVHLTVDDVRTAQLAGARFARTLAGADLADYALALAEQEHLVERAIVDAGYSAKHFGVAARGEWVRIVSASGLLDLVSA